MRGRIALVVILSLVALVGSTPASVYALHDNTCHPPPPTPPGPTSDVLYSAAGNSGDMLYDIDARINPGMKLVVHGTVEIHDGTSSTVLIAENRGASATCAASGDGGIDILELIIPFRYHRSGERVSATIDLGGSNITESGEYDARLQFDDADLGVFSIRITADFEHHPRSNADRARHSGKPVANHSAGRSRN